MNEKSLYCSKCQLNWPPERETYSACPDCGQHTFWSSTTEPDAWTQVAPSIAHLWRVERYLELGFSEVDAQLLALVRDSVRIPDRKGTPRTWTFPLNWQKVAAALDAGCSLPLARRIFA